MREQASKGALRFEAYLPSALAEWLLDFVERGVFTDPSEAVFVILGEHKELEPHADLRKEILRRSLDAAINDPRPSLPGKEAMAQIARLFAEPRPQPAVWQQRQKNNNAAHTLPLTFRRNWRHKGPVLTNELPTLIASDFFPLIFRITRVFGVRCSLPMEERHA